MRLITLLLAVMLYSCGQPQPPKTVDISFDIKNTSQEKMIITGLDFEQELDVKDGKATGNLAITKEGVYDATSGSNSSSLYLKPGDKVSISYDAGERLETIKIDGPNTDIQSALTKLAMIKADDLGRDLYSKSADEVKVVLGEYQRKVQNAMANLSDDMKTNILKDASYNIAFAKQLFIMRKGEDATDLPADFASSTAAIDLRNESEFLRSSAYRDLVDIDFTDKLYADETSDYTEVMKSLLAKIAPGAIKNSLLYNQMRYMLGPNAELEDNFEYFKKNSTDQDHIAELSQKYVDLQALSKGKKSPSFDYMNAKGGNTKLGELAGKYVYVDVWATWCGPCIGEIPSLKKREKEYHGKNIEFVSISIDNVDDEQKWRDMISNRKLGGEQLMADNAWQSQFVQDYMIDGIPRFILIDPDGNIVSADAPRPSDDKLEDMLGTLAL